MNYILENTNSIDFFTYLPDVFKAIGNIQTSYNWMITDYECNGYLDFRTDGRVLWYTGDELTELVEKNQIQFIWGVLSGFPKNVTIDRGKSEVFPYADCNSGLWSPHVSIQHPDAEIEIVCFDSSATLFMSLDERISRQYSDYYVDARNLNQMNLETFVNRVKTMNNIYPIGSIKRNSPCYKYLSYLNLGIVMYLSERFDESVLFFRRAIRARKNLIMNDNDKKFYSESMKLMKQVLQEVDDYGRVTDDILGMSRLLIKDLEQL